MAPIIRVEQLTKVYRNYDRREGIGGALVDLFHRRWRNIRAVDGISFQIAPGEMVGYIGANGAGKSTTIKMLTGILRPTSGSILANGIEPRKARYAHARQIGVVFGQRTQLWWDLAVIEAFNLLQKLYQIPLADYRRRLDRAISVLDISGQLHTPVRKLSLGQRMKCDLCASLLHNPPLLFLDEPTIGLDVAVKERIRRFIQEINREEGSTIILTTHDMTDIERLCPRLIFIDQGQLLYDGPTQEIVERFGRRRRVVIEFKRDYPPEYASRPLPASDVPLSIAGSTTELLSLPAAPQREDELAPGTEADKATAGEIQDSPADETPAMLKTNGLSLLDEPGARQFMAELSALMDNGDLLPVRRLSSTEYQISFDRQRYSAGAVIGRLLERYEVDDLALRDPELTDIVRGIYEGQHAL